MPRCQVAEEAEAISVQIGFSELMCIYKGPLCIETDGSQVISLLNPGVPNRSALFPIVADIKNKTDNFQKITLMSTRRDNNRLAHEIAAHARKCGDPMMLAGFPPDLKVVLVKERRQMHVSGCVPNLKKLGCDSEF